jgi:FkbM family methyltransferase
MIYQILTRILAPRMGKQRHQIFFEGLYKLSLAGMNIGGGAHVADSGELNALNYIKGRLNTENRRTDLILFDVGANIGDYSLLLKEVFGAQAIVHSFEPSKKTYVKLAANLSKQVNCYQHNFGLGDKADRVVLYTDHDESGLASVYKRKLDHYNIDMNQSEDIVLQTLDAFCAENEITHVNFLKIDVEGHEKNVLHGAKQMMDAGKIDFIQFEFGGTSIDARSYFQDYFYLLNDKYQVHRIVKDGVHPISAYNELYELFLPTNFLAVRRGLR